MKTYASIAFLILLLWSPVPVSASTFFPDMATAKTAYKNKDYQTAAENWIPLAHRGNAEAQLALGKLYTKGQGVKQNYQTALNLFLAAAAQNNARAMFEIGKLYESGYGILKAPQKAKRWYEKAAQNGYARGYYSIGRLYEKRKIGISKEERSQKATKYFKLAEANGYLPADKRYVTLQSFQIETRKKYKVITDFKTQFTGEENLDLGTANNDLETAFVLNGKIGAYLYPTDDITTYFEARGLYSDGVATSDSDDDEDTTNLNFVEMRQAWVEFDQLWNIPILSLKAGRQRFYEPRGLWWNRDLDAARLSLNSTLTNSFIAIGENLSKYRIGDDNDLEREEEKRLRILGELSHQPVKNHEIGLRFLYEEDHSGTKNIGQTVPDNDRDTEDNNLLWAGARASGKTDNITYRADIMAVRGEETITTTTPGPGADLRTVSTITDRDVFGWGFDGSINIELDTPLEPTLTVGYAYGSGDDGNGDNNAFRQTGLEGNTSISPAGRASSALRNYGEVLRPELSNLHIVNTGINIPVFQASDINLNYFNYWLDENATTLRSSGISARLNNSDKHVGQALDLAVNINIGKELDIQNTIFKNTAFRIRLGGFKAGEAYGSGEDEYAYRGSTELRVKF